VKSNRSIPPATVIPVLVYPDVRAAVSWLTTAFGFVERVRIGESHRAQLSIGDDGAMIVAEPGGEKEPPQSGTVSQLIKLRVEDVQTAFERARSAGARVLEPPTDRPYGERECAVEDLAGHRWQLTQTIRDVAPEEYGCQTIEAWAAPRSRLPDGEAASTPDQR
jgi:uncharacterized glyoxalase superfamily protein PhnB